MPTQRRLVEVFIELADTLVDAFDPIDLMHTLARRTVELLDADAAGLMLVDRDGQLQLLAASSEETRVLELFELQQDEGPCLDAFRLGEPVINVDQAAAERRWPTFAAAVRAGNYTTVHAVPMRLRDRVIGAMNLFQTGPGGLSEDNAHLAQGLADIATIALLQERIIQHHQGLSGQLQRALESRVVIEQAKGILAERHGVSLTQAFDAVRAHARRTRQPLAKVAAEAIDGTLEDIAWGTP
ncbi:GAF and ANTAR domain-containing protein [Allobranchiibius sp. CTAmp26]|uniref:GAF and ANTAR domain-containing protein n=1 Tax=Allobranchiibius sp. CTAmp26 TaxID=2815214 RepID=UPI001AA1C7F5|nr:GAF and ANTAR domain-containing protein [Allobranchiibius sp. CTAmp26]MBO1755495.1 GAF and ANTAR domain-containing protein [Allobranchiibius sp. CTAmp26]